MRKFFMTGLALAATGVLATPALALEKTSARMIDRGDDWSASATGTLRY